MEPQRREPDHPEIPVSGGAFAVVAGKRFDIKAVSLHGGEIHFIAYRPGPSGAFAGYVTVFGSDGIGICQAAGEFDVPAAKGSEIIRYDIRLRMDKTEKA